MLRRVEGAAHATNTNGAIVGQDLRGGAHLSTTFGPIEARAVRGGLRVVNAHGDVHVTDVEGATSLSTTFGTVVADRVRGALNIEGSKGEVRGVSLTGSVNVTTSFAPVILRQVAGRTEVRNSNGPVDVGLAPTASACDVSLTTTSGPIDVYVGNGGYAVAAQSRFGRVRADVPLLKKGRLGANWVSGTIGTGACPLRLVNTDGNITLQPGAGPVVDPEIQRPRTARPFLVPPARP